MYGCNRPHAMCGRFQNRMSGRLDRSQKPVRAFRPLGAFRNLTGLDERLRGVLLLSWTVYDFHECRMREPRRLDNPGQCASDLLKAISAVRT